ncbi:MAG: molybdopterin-dependent oxidoreductase [Propionibacteriales bacterium]|nr:molybdopterin-dependent oxidoreductase [Propionibacteriales bacterium]
MSDTEILAPPTVSGGMIGESVARPDARTKCRGEAVYVGDLELPGMLHAKVLRSPVGHAHVERIDLTAAARTPGLVRLVTAADLPSANTRYGHILRDQPILADDVVRFVGEPVVIAVAGDEAAATEALDLVDVSYDPLPTVDLDTALSPDAPLVHPEPVEPSFLRSPLVDALVQGNVCYKYTHRRGEPDAALAAAAHVVEHDYTFPSAYQYAMEPHSAIAHRQGTSLSVWSSCQHPFLVRQELAQLFGLDLDDVRMQVLFVGGGYGSKSYTTIEPMACLAAWCVNAPVRLVNTVEESILTTRQHNMRARVLTAAGSDGRVLLRRAEILMDTGAYGTNGPTVAFMTGVSAPGPYDWQAVDVVARCVYTNRCPAGSYRGFGSSHTQWIGESQLDEIAQLAGLDRFELRRRNLLPRGGLIHSDMKPLDADLRPSLDRLENALAERPSPAPGRRIGTGIGFGVVPAGAEPIANAVARLRRDGRARVIVGTTEIGQGARTVFAQIAAHVLGVPLSAVTVPGADTSVTPYDRSTGASRSTTMVGLAVERACRDIVGQLAATAAHALGVSAEHVVYEQACFSAADGTMLPLHDVLATLGMAGDELVGRGRVGGGADPTDSPVFWEVCGSAAVVEVDERTGGVSVQHTLGLPDVGTAIHPQLVAVQDSGCTVQALGQTLLEQLVFGPDGALLTPSLVQYRVPLAGDIPVDMDCELVENGDGPGPFGAKGCGEGPFGAIPAALVTALQDVGVQVRDLPVTPERVWQSLHDEGGHGDS